MEDQPCLGAQVSGLQPFGVRWPPRTTVEATIIDVATDATADDIASWLARGLNRQITTPDRLLRELASRRRQPQRELVAGMIRDVRDGNESTLEIRFVRGVLRRHGLPLGTAQLSLEAIDPELAGRRAPTADIRSSADAHWRQSGGTVRGERIVDDSPCQEPDRSTLTAGRAGTPREAGRRSA